jgi:hypothetical protein
MEHKIKLFHPEISNGPLVGPLIGLLDHIITDYMPYVQIYSPTPHTPLPDSPLNITVLRPLKPQHIILTCHTPFRLPVPVYFLSFSPAPTALPPHWILLFWPNGALSLCVTLVLPWCCHYCGADACVLVLLSSFVATDDVVVAIWFCGTVIMVRMHVHSFFCHHLYMQTSLLLFQMVHPNWLP